MTKYRNGKISGCQGLTMGCGWKGNARGYIQGQSWGIPVEMGMFWIYQGQYLSCDIVVFARGYHWEKLSKGSCNLLFLTTACEAIIISKEMELTYTAACVLTKAYRHALTYLIFQECKQNA